MTADPTKDASSTDALLRFFLSNCAISGEPFIAVVEIRRGDYP